MSLHTNCVAAFFLALLPCCSPALEPAGDRTEEPILSDPFASVDEPFHDLGEVLPDERFEHIFRFRNDREKSFELIRAFTSCGCTSYELEKKRWGPGDTGKVSMVMDSDPRSGRMSSDLTLLVRDDEGNRWAQDFQLTCTVVATEILFADCSVVDLGEEAMAGVTVHCRLLDETEALDGSTFATPLRVTGSSEGLTIDGADFQVGEGDQEFFAQTTVKRDAISRAIKGTLTFTVEFADGHERKLHLPVRGDAASPLRASSRSLFLGSVAAGDRYTKRLTVDGLKGEEGSLATSNDWVKASWDGSERSLLVNVTAPEAAGVFQGWIEVQKRSGEGLRIPVVGTVQ